jgi:DNA repair photolyase
MAYSLIYQPKGRAREYAPLACNVYSGCDHSCSYCYGPSAVRRTQAEFVKSTTRGPDFLTRLSREAHARQRQGQGGRVLLCFTCDAYQHLDEELGITREVIRILHSTGHAVEILTKGGRRALRDLDLFGPEDAFATTMTLLDDAQSLEWEPGAAVASDRIATIEKFHTAGIPTWVSLEPVLDPAVALQIIKETYAFVDLFKVGVLNYASRLPDHLRSQVEGIDWRAFGMAAIDLLRSLGKPYYIKRDLVAHLPAEYRGLCDTRAVQVEVAARQPETAQLSLL